jgi:hypothetical protein
MDVRNISHIMSVPQITAMGLNDVIFMSLIIWNYARLQSLRIGFVIEQQRVGSLCGQHTT